MRIVAIIQAWNEGANGRLAASLNYAARWADDIVVLDDSSVDNTYEVAHQFTSHVLQNPQPKQPHPQIKNVERLTNYAVQNLDPDWIIKVDADLYLSKPLMEGKIRDFLKDINHRQVIMPIYNVWRGDTWERVDHGAKFSIRNIWKVDDRPLLFYQGEVTTNAEIHIYGDLPLVDCQDCYVVTDPDFCYLHLGFRDFEKYIYRLYGYTQEEIQRWAPEFLATYRNSWILDERELQVLPVPLHLYPDDHPLIESTMPSPLEYLSLEDVYSFARNYNYATN